MLTAALPSLHHLEKSDVSSKTLRFERSSNSISLSHFFGAVLSLMAKQTGRDVVMSYATSLFGVTLDPVEAGKLFPIEIKVKRM